MVYKPLISFLAGKKYTLLDGVALVCMSVGLILFTLADNTVQPNFDQTGKMKIIMGFSGTSQAVAGILAKILIVKNCQIIKLNFVNTI